MKTLKTLAFASAIIFSMGCSSSYDKEALGTTADTLSVTGLTGDDVKLIKKADMDFKVNDVHESARAIVKVTHSLKGLVTDRRIESQKTKSKELRISDDTLQVINSYLVRADMEVRIPSAELDTFIEQVYNNASFMNRITVQIEDKTLDYLASRLKQQNREQVLKTPEQNRRQEQPTPEGHMSNKIATKPVDVIERRDEQIEQQIANRQINADVNYSTVHLSFTQNPSLRMELVPNTDLSFYRLPFASSMSNAFFDGWQYFLSFVIGIAHFWMFILLIILIITGRKYYLSRAI